jgi:hypothetical protein
MLIRLLVLIAAAVMLPAVDMPALYAQAPAASRAENIPDLMGIWNADFTGFGGRFTREDPPLTPQALAIFRRNREGLSFEETGLDERDPLTFCFPVGSVRQMMLRQFELVQSPKEVILIHEFNSEVRRIYMDGRAHPDGWPFGWMGHSTGRYDGDSLVVDTVGFNDKTWFDRAGTPHSDALHVVERFRRPAQETLAVDFRFEDPKTFTRSWTASREFKLRPDLEVLEHVTCEDYLKIGNR